MGFEVAQRRTALHLFRSYRQNRDQPLTGGSGEFRVTDFARIDAPAIARSLDLRWGSPNIITTSLSSSRRPPKVQHNLYRQLRTW